MAPITRFVALAALVAIGTARPLMPRDPSMVTETTWTTVDVPVTVWVNEQGAAVSTEVPGGIFAAVPTSPAAAVASTTTPAPVAPAQPSSPSTTMVTTTSVFQSPVATSTTTTSPPPAAAVVTTTPAPVAVSSSAAPVSSASPASGGTGSAAGAFAQVLASATDSNTCDGEDAACQGDITYYTGGLGACGWNIDTNSDMQLALPFEFMGTESNDNPYCGRSLTILNPTTGQTVQAKVGDKCMGCSGRSIDLTEVLFQAIGPECNGRCHGFDWWFN